MSPLGRIRRVRSKHHPNGVLKRKVYYEKAYQCLVMQNNTSTPHPILFRLSAQQNRPLPQGEENFFAKQN